MSIRRQTDSQTDGQTETDGQRERENAHKFKSETIGDYTRVISTQHQNSSENEVEKPNTHTHRLLTNQLGRCSATPPPKAKQYRRKLLRHLSLCLVGLLVRSRHRRLRHPPPPLGLPAGQLGRSSAVRQRRLGGTHGLLPQAHLLLEGTHLNILFVCLLHEILVG